MADTMSSPSATATTATPNNDNPPPLPTAAAATRSGSLTTVMSSSSTSAAAATVGAADVDAATEILPGGSGSTAAAAATSSSSPSLHSSVVGTAVAVTLLLKDHARYSLTERVSYHFHLTETLGSAVTTAGHVAAGGGGSINSTTLVSEAPSSNNNNNPLSVSSSSPSSTTKPVAVATASTTTTSAPVCGIAQILECVPTNRKQRVALQTSLALANQQAAAAMAAQPPHHPPSGGGVSSLLYCHEPPTLPLRLNPSSRVFFAYQTTRIALVLDASPTLTCTFGFGVGADDYHHSSGSASTSTGGTGANSDCCCCPLDRLADMTRTFFTALVETIPLRQQKNSWQPVISVSVLAVYPRSSAAAASSSFQATTTCATTDANNNNNNNANRKTTPTSKRMTEEDEPPPASLLVRDYSIRDKASVEQLCQNIEKWALGEVESEIARRLNQHHHHHHHRWNADPWDIPLHSSSLQDLMQAGDAALSTMSSAARPVLVVATDGRSVSCGAIVDIVHCCADADRVDVPLIVLDLSSPTSHEPVWTNNSSNNNSNISSSSSSSQQGASNNNMRSTILADRRFPLLNYDPGGAMFPLYLSDDTEALHGICKATGGCFFDAALLHEAARMRAGQVEPPDSILAEDPFFTFRRHALRPNAVQWYTLISLSPLTPTFCSSWGKLAPPTYLRRRLAARAAAISTDTTAAAAAIAATPPTFMVGSPGAAASSLPPITGGGVGISGGSGEHRRGHGPSVSFSSSVSGTRACPSGADLTKKSHVRRVFSTYIINPIRILSLLLTRVKEGYRVKQYGQSTNDLDKVFIMFSLSLEVGTVLHYEIAYQALASQNHHNHVGSASIRIELSGEAGFVQMVKKDFLHQQHGHFYKSRPLTLAQQVSQRLCKILRWIRKEDMLQSYLSPSKWTDQLSTPDTPFIRRLGTLTSQQTRRHFRFDQFDCVCVGRTLTADFLEAFRDVDGEDKLINTIARWATRAVPLVADTQPQELKALRRYVRKTPKGASGLACYCLIEITQSRIAEHLFTVSVETFGGGGTSDRLAALASLKDALAGLSDVTVLDKQLDRYLVAIPGSIDLKQRFLECQHNHASWDLVNDPQLLPLLIRRRTEIGGYLLLDSRYNYALLARLEPRSCPNDEFDDPGDLVQYQISIFPDKAVVDLHMESEGGAFRSSMVSRHRINSNFQSMVERLKIRDQECGRALRSRTSLLRVFVTGTKEDQSPFETHTASMSRLLQYASQTHLRLRFFHTKGSGSANDHLHSLTRDLLLSAQLGPKVAQLCIDGKSNTIDEAGPGDWFLLEYDKHTMGIGHLSLTTQCDVADEERSYRILTLYTMSVSDLYIKRKDFDVDDGVEELEEYMCATEFMERVASAHSQLFQSGLYMALKNPESTTQVDMIHFYDLRDVMQSVEFVEVASVQVSRGSPKLTQLIGTICQPIPCAECESYFVYIGGTSTFLLPVDDDDSDIFHIGEATYLDEGIEEDELARREEGYLDSVARPERLVQIGTPSSIFARFMLDDKPASYADLQSCDKSSTLTALVSVSKVEPSIPDLAAAVQLAGCLNAYVAEETLERLRRHGPNIEPADLQLARICQRKARDVMTAKLDLFFYNAARDAMVPAGGGEIQVEEGFRLFENELMSSSKLLSRDKNASSGTLPDAISLKADGFGGFVAVNTDDDGALLYWCFVTIKKPRGIVCLEVHHPSGPDEANKVLSTVTMSCNMSCHRVNQLLLLRHLHASRTTSSLLIDEEISAGSQLVDRSPFCTGFFACPVVFRRSFELFHRCATNPAQVAATLESTVLRVFSVSNQRHMFVYKDETGAIFYMRLATSGGGLDADGQVELIVNGIDEPGLSVTSQLTRLVSKKLMTIAVELLSSVLMKNPRYYWKPADLSFVMNFSGEHKKLEDTEVNNSIPNQVFYEVPSSICDPGMVLLYFRQNLCGSEYFNPLFGTSPRRSDDGDATIKGPAYGDLQDINFVFYFNSAASKLNASLQGRSTLTDKGLEYTRLAGAGLAVVEVTLVDGHGKKMKGVRVSDRPHSWVKETESSLEVPLDSLRFKNVNSGDVFLAGTDELGASRRYVSVRITDTAVRRDILHDWILLSLNQVLVGFQTETLLVRQQCLPLIRAQPSISSRSQSGPVREEAIEQFCSGLPALISTLESSVSLPHPAIKRVECEGVTRSSTVASVALEFLEKTCTMIQKDAMDSLDLMRDLRIIRLSRGNRNARLVSLGWEKDRRQAVARELASSGDNTNGDVIQDKPIDCPEYLMYYCFPEWEEGRAHQKLPKLFDEVRVGGDDNGDSGLSRVKSQHPEVFRRSFAFIFSIKRNRRLLLSYNWSTDLYNSVASQLGQLNKSLLLSAGQSTDSLQRRSLRLLSPLPIARHHPEVIPRRTSQSTASAVVKVEPTPVDDQPTPMLTRTSSRRAIRPVAIRRPRLIGKSVEGAALHAVAASRDRAKFKGTYGTPSQTASKQSTAVATSTDSRAMTPKRSNEGRGDDNHALNPEERELLKVINDFRSLTSVNKLYRLHTLSFTASRMLTASLWPIKPKQSASTPVVDFLLSQGTLGWTDSVELRFPREIAKGIARSFCYALATWVPGLRVIHVGPVKNSTDYEAVLMGEVKNVRSSKFFPVLKISVSFTHEERTYMMMQGWVLTIPRRAKTLPHDIAPEKESAAADKVLADLIMTVPLETSLFDYVCAVIERIMKSSEGAMSTAESLKLAVFMADRYGLQQQMTMLKSQYKIVRAPLILSSYGDPIINKFAGPGQALFDWMVDNAELRGLTLCGPNGISFRRDIIVRGTRSICFLVRDTREPTTMVLIFVCRTHGRDLSEFMFRQGSNVAITVANGIAIEGAGLVHKELRAAATSLNHLALWRALSSRGGPAGEPSQKDVHELLELSCVKHITRYLDDGADGQKLRTLLDLRIDWRRCCELMKNDPGFSPSWTVVAVEAHCRYMRLFFLDTEDLFLLIAIDDKLAVQINIVDRVETTASSSLNPERRQKVAIQKVLNYFLHFVWGNALIKRR